MPYGDEDVIYEDYVPQTEIKEFNDDILVEKCVYGDKVDSFKWSACLELAKRCNSDMHQHLNGEERKILRQKLFSEGARIEGTRTKKFEDSKYEEVEIPYSSSSTTPLKTKVPQTLWGIYESEGVDEPITDGMTDKQIETIFRKATIKTLDKYLERWEKDPYGKCAISLYGSEYGFFDEVGDYPFQSRASAKIQKDIDILVFDEGADVDDDKVVPSGDPAGTWWKHCKTVIMNPLIEPEKYQICSEANLDNQQHMMINKKSTIKEQIMTDSWDKLVKIVMADVWKATPSHHKVSILMIAFLENPNTFRNYDVNTIEKYEEDYYNYNDSQRAALLKAYNTYGHDELVEITDNIPAQVEYKEANKLSCWHIFYQRISMAKDVYKEQVKIEMAHKYGEITDDEFKEMMADLYERGESASVDVEPGQEREEHITNYTKRVRYMPIRPRAWASQMALYKRFVQDPHYIAYKDLRGDQYTQEAIEQALDEDDWRALYKREILTDYEKKFMKRFPNVNIDQVWECLSKVSKEYTEDYIYQEGWQMVDYNDYEDNFNKLMDIIGIDHDDFSAMKYKVSIDDEPDAVTEFNESAEPIEIISGTIQHSDEWEDMHPQDWMVTFKECFPNITVADIDYIFERDLGEPFYSNVFYWDVSISGAIPYGDLERAAIFYSDELEHYIEDASKVEAIRDDIKLYIVLIAGEKGFNTYWDIIHDIKLEEEQGHNTSLLKNKLKNRGYKEGIHY